MAAHLTGGVRAQVEEAFESAAISSGGVMERRYRIAGHALLLRCAGRELMAELGSALDHLAETGDRAVELTVLAWDGSVGVPFPAEPSSMAPPVWERRPWFLEFDPAGEQIAGPPWRRVSGLLDESTGVFWACDPTSLPIHDRGAPLRSLVHRWLSELGVRVVHAGAVATAAGAALLVGGGGTGKSTTSLACRESGLDFLGDDYVAIELEPMQVHSLYCSAKISWKHPAPVASGLTAVNRDRSDEKALFFLPDRAIAIAPIRAIIAPRVVVGSASRLNPISAGQALAAFAPSSVLQLPGDPGPTLADLRTLCNQVPAFELLLGSDIEVVGELVEQALMS